MKLTPILLCLLLCGCEFDLSQDSLPSPRPQLTPAPPEQPEPDRKPVLHAKCYDPWWQYQCRNDARIPNHGRSVFCVPAFPHQAAAEIKACPHCGGIAVLMPRHAIYLHPQECVWHYWEENGYVYPNKPCYRSTPYQKPAGETDIFHMPGWLK